MLQKLNSALTIFIGALAGVFVVNAIYVFWDCFAYPDLYAAQSAPWYTSILFYGIAIGSAIIVLIIIKLLLRVKIRQQFYAHLKMKDNEGTMQQ